MVNGALGQNLFFVRSLLAIKLLIECIMLFVNILKWFFAPFFLSLGFFSFFANLGINSISEKKTFELNGWRGSIIINIIIDYNCILYYNICILFMVTSIYQMKINIGMAIVANVPHQIHITNVDKLATFFYCCSFQWNKYDESKLLSKKCGKMWKNVCVFFFLDHFPSLL